MTAFPDLPKREIVSDGSRRPIAGFPRRLLIWEGGRNPLLLILVSDAAASLTGGLFPADDGQTV